MVVVVPGHDRQEAVERDPAENWMETALLPLGGRQFAECLQRLDAALTKRGERMASVVREVLALLGPAVKGSSRPAWGPRPSRGFARKSVFSSIPQPLYPWRVGENRQLERVKEERASHADSPDLRGQASYERDGEACGRTSQCPPATSKGGYARIAPSFSSSTRCSATLKTSH